MVSKSKATKSDFFSKYNHGFATVASVSLPVRLADPMSNGETILRVWRRLHAEQAAVAFFPELALSGYSNDDLFHQDALVEATVSALNLLLHESANLDPLIAVGASLPVGNSLYNVAVFLQRGRILGVVPKYHLPNYSEFYEERYFHAPKLGENLQLYWSETQGFCLATPHSKGSRNLEPEAFFINQDLESTISAKKPQVERGVLELKRTPSGSAEPLLSDDYSFPFGLVQFEATDIPGLTVAAEICEDMWVSVSPGSLHSLAGATVIGNLSASPVKIGRALERKQTVAELSARNKACYCYTAAGFGESSTDLSWDGQCLIYELGELLARSKRFYFDLDEKRLDPFITKADVDLDAIRLSRIRQNTFSDNLKQLGLRPTLCTRVSFTSGIPARVKPKPQPGLRLGFSPTLAAASATDTSLRNEQAADNLGNSIQAVNNPPLQPSKSSASLTNSHPTSETTSTGDACNSVYATTNSTHRSNPLQPLYRPLNRFPFVPQDSTTLDQDCYESFNIQVSALMRRMRAGKVEKLVIGVSGGLDSTLALLVCARAMDLLRLPRSNVLAYTMPGFGTTSRSLTDAKRLTQKLGVSFATLDIRSTSLLMLDTIGHPSASDPLVKPGGNLPSVAADPLESVGEPPLTHYYKNSYDFLTKTLIVDGNVVNNRGFSDDLTISSANVNDPNNQDLGSGKIDSAGSTSPFDTTFENVQAGLRTDYLFRLANYHQAIVVGTGDLSELALGWCTYGVGDQMSHYGVNAGLPKTMIQHLISWVAKKEFFGSKIVAVLQSILSAEISPELLPTKEDKPQSTQDTIGPYELHDFTLHYLLQGFAPRKIAYLAYHCWCSEVSTDSLQESSSANQAISQENSRTRDRALLESKHDYSATDALIENPLTTDKVYDFATVLKWMRIFYQRFFSSQFKRTALPNGPKILSSGSLSPRGDWRMPSDALAKAWIEQLEGLEK